LFKVLVVKEEVAAAPRFPIVVGKPRAAAAEMKGTC